METQANTLAGVTALLLCSCATAPHDQVAADAPMQAMSASATDAAPPATTSTTTTSTTTVSPATTTVPPSEATQQNPAATSTTTTQSTSTTAAGTPDEATTSAPAVAGPNSATTSTTSTESTAPDKSAATAAATAADVKAGVSVYDKDGGLIGKIDSVSGKNAIVSTGKVKASIPISSFAKNDKGLVLAMTKAEIEAAAKKPTKK